MLLFPQALLWYSIMFNFSYLIISCTEYDHCWDYGLQDDLTLGIIFNSTVQQGTKLSTIIRQSGTNDKSRDHYLGDVAPVGASPSPGRSPMAMIRVYRSTVRLEPCAEAVLQKCRAGARRDVCAEEAVFSESECATALMGQPPSTLVCDAVLDQVWTTWTADNIVPFIIYQGQELEA
jgi:hypothetical protein